ncbi:hypothetical protein PPL_08168 [Heterostelium album PN500]|uniref:C-type lectin domain-containing protein n=1 Tax=Heterostelium pallidum (strain ATCC 26659 / Pp 5 / PN500) TaxID=670386 RepID=D3BIT3_HETP5|nr:hypothetical protein PPL_08168 [Heterostelium album PN500]EFA78707.1 hypothetical protein PPL_08168 [Heterostelium album PN500]|eukprot:XP_020430831.1 hypothetical protein PPL_08168 [Heterostelium album PN500]
MKIFIIFIFIGLFLSIASGFVNQYAYPNPANGHYYQPLDDSNPVTYEEALNYQVTYTNMSSSYKYYLLTLNDYAEYKFILNLMHDMLNLDIWLGAVPMDADQNSWAWRNGTARSQAFYTTYPERCYQFCGDFAGNLNTSQPHLYFKAYGTDMNFYPASATDKKFMVIEWEPIPDGPILTFQEMNSQSINVLNFNQSNIVSMTIDGVACQSFKFEGVLTKCQLLASFVASSKIYKVVLSSATQTWTTTYQFNVPWVYSIRNIQGTAYRLYVTGASMVATESNFLVVGTSLKGTPTRTTTNLGLDYWDITISDAFNKVYSIKLVFTNAQIYVSINRAAIFDSGTQRFYSFFPNVNDYSVASKIMQSSTLLFDTPTPALEVISASLGNFFTSQFMVDGIANYWTVITTNSTGTYWNNQLLTLTISGSVSGPFYYFDSSSKQITGVTQTQLASITNPPNFHVILAYGYGSLTFDTKPQIYSVDAQVGGVVSVAMSSNFFSVEPVLTCNYTLGSPTVNFLSKTFSVRAAAGSGVNYISVQIGNSFENKMRNFTIRQVYNPPTISNIVVFNALVTITGSSFATPIKVNGVNCSGPAIDAGGRILCQLQDLPSTTFNWQVSSAGQLSNFYTFTTPIYSWITSVPTKVSLEPSTVTVSGVYLGSNPTFLISGSSVQGRLINSSYFEVDVPGNLYAGGSVFYNLANTGNPVINNGVLYSTYTGLTISNSNITQYGKTITVTGEDFNLYNGNFTFVVGNSTFDVLCQKPNLCIATVPDTASNGVFTILSKPSNSYLFNETKTWTPVILKAIPPIVDVNGGMVVSALFIDRLLAVKYYLNGKYLVFGKSRSGYNTTLSNFPKFVGSFNLTFVNSNLNLISLPYGIDYPGPIISSAIVNPNNIDELLFTGSYLGFSDTDTYPDEPLSIPVISGLSKTRFGPTNYDVNKHIFDNFTVTLPDDARSGIFSILVGKKFTLARMNLTPKIDTVTKSPVPGGFITITGKYISPISFDGVSVMKVYIDDQPANATLLTQTYPYNVEISMPAGIGSKQLKMDNSLFNSSVTVYYETPSISSVTSTYFNTKAPVTIFGSNFGVFQPFSVTIGNKSCDNPKVESTQIICDFASDVPSNGQSLTVNVTIFGQSYLSQGFIYLPDFVKCDGCSPVNGQCLNGYCKCLNGFTGINCTTEIILPTQSEVKNIDPPKPQNDTVTMVLGSAEKNVQFNISIVSITERDSSSNPVKSYQFSDIKWTSESTNSSLVFNYKGKFDGDAKLTIDVETTVFTNQSEYNFQGDIFTVQNNSMKYVITISNWTFADKLNTLELSFLSKADNSKSVCGDDVQAKVGGTSSNSLKSLRTMEIVQGDIILTAYFSDRMLVDGRIAYSKVSQPETDSSTAGSLFVTTTMTIQHFENQAVIDPNFGALLTVSDDSSSGGCSTSEKENKWKLPVIIVGKI